MRDNTHNQYFMKDKATKIYNDCSATHPGHARTVSRQRAAPTCQCPRPWVLIDACMFGYGRWRNAMPCMVSSAVPMEEEEEEEDEETQEDEEEEEEKE
eukprot:8863068-Pyramimonas_sp.AAC.1